MRFGSVPALCSLAAFAALALTGAPATAATIFEDSFDAEGGTVLNYTGFTNWTVSEGSVDLVKSGDYGITCLGGSGACVDLDGTSSDGGRIDSTPFSFNAGDRVELVFWMSGNQRGGSADDFTVGFIFAGPNGALIDSSFTGGSFGDNEIDGGGLLGSISAGGTLAWNTGFNRYVYGFVAGGAGTGQVIFGDLTGADNIGPVLDNVGLSITQTGIVPEPATWAMMLAGFGLVGAGLRRRRALTA